MKRVGALAFVVGLLMFPELAGAAVGGGSGMPWDQGFTALMDNLTGVVGPIIVTMAVVALGLGAMWASHGIVGRAGGAVVGGSIVFGFAALMAALGWAGAVV
jgi:type IV secretory pathway VirB2 component (pilin)